MGKALNTRLDGSEVTLKKASCLGVFVKIIPTPTSSRTLLSTSHSPPFLTCVDFSFATSLHFCRFPIRHLSSLVSISHSPAFLSFFFFRFLFFLLLCTFTFSTYVNLYSRNEFSGFSQDSKWKSILIINLSLIFGFFISQSIKVELNWCC